MKHDYNVYKKNILIYQRKYIVGMFDLGFLGVQKDFPTELKSSLLIKKKRNQILTYEEAVYNKNHSKRRI
ncbi:hypothetical protein BH23THE1_BH23THE1_10620 [soil metagenome]